MAEDADLFEGDYVTVQFRPFEADAEGTRLDDFQEWMDETGYELAELAMVGWINADLAFQGLLAAGPSSTAQTVIDATNQMTDYNADGLINPIDWTRQHDAAARRTPATTRGRNAPRWSRSTTTPSRRMPCRTSLAVLAGRQPGLVRARPQPPSTEPGLSTAYGPGRVGPRTSSGRCSRARRRDRLRPRRARLRPHLQDVGGLQPRLRRPGVRLRRAVLPGPERVGVGTAPALSCRCSWSRRSSGCCSSG